MHQATTQPETTPKLHLKLLGYPEVYLSEERLKLPTQKLQAILFYLAIKKQSSREELSELLWEPDARHRLRPELHRLRNLPGAEQWLELDDRARISVHTDIDRFETLVKDKDWQSALAQYPQQALLLQGFSIDDAPRFMDWLEEARANVQRQYGEALRERAFELASEQQLGEALDLVDALLDLDPLDESAYRTAMRLEYTRGHLQAALQHYDHCRRTLAEELSLEPSEETQSLAREIQKGLALPTYPIGAKHRLPKTLLRPPSLIGREAEWARMEEAFQAGQAIFISGPAGSGKTRLMLDFAHSKGVVVMAEGRIGDVNIPLSTISRVFQSYLAAFPDNPPEPWIMQEISRLVRSDVSANLAPGDKTRLFEVVEKFFALASKYVNVFPTDNLHYFDPLSAEVTNQAGFKFFSQKVPGRCAINTFRPEAMPKDFFLVLDHFIALGIAIHIELEPLDLDAVQQLLVSLKLPDNNQLSRKLHHLTGGNPQFVIETLKSLHTTGQLDNVPDRISLPERLAFVLRKRLDGLSPLALRIARAVATLEQQLDTDDLAALLELNAFDIAEGLAELEEAQIFKQNQFVHDLLQESSKQQTPAAVQRLLHKRRAGLLEKQGSDASRIAHHYFAADERDRALPWHLKAIEEAIHTGFISQAQTWVESLLFEVPEEQKTYQQALILKGQLLLQQDLSQAQRCFQECLQLSRYVYPEIEASALKGLAECARQKRKFPEALALIASALQLPLPAAQNAELLHVQGVTFSQNGKQAEAEVSFLRALQQDPDTMHYAMALATLRWHQGRFRDNAQMLLELLRRKPEAAKLSLLHHNIGAAYWALGQASEAFAWMNKSFEIWQHSGHTLNKAMTQLSMGSVLTTLGRLKEARVQLKEAQSAFATVGIRAMHADAQIRQAYLYVLAGRQDSAAQEITSALETLDHHPEPFLQSYALACLSSVQTLRGNPKVAQDLAQQALSQAETLGHPLAIMIALRSAIYACTDDASARVLTDRLHEIALKQEALEYLSQALLYKARLCNTSVECVTLAKEALTIAEKHGMAMIGLEAASMLCEAGESKFEKSKLKWQDVLIDNRLD